MARAKTQNIPAYFVNLGREIVGFLQTVLDYKNQLIQTGMQVKWGNTTLPVGGFLSLDGSTVTKANYPDLWSYAQGDAAYTTTSTDLTLPVVAGYVVKT